MDSKLFTDKRIKMVNFELGNVMRGTNRNSSSPTAMELMTSRTPGGCAIHCATRTHGEEGHLNELI